jgi:hypothetical protein
MYWRATSGSFAKLSKSVELEMCGNRLTQIFSFREDEAPLDFGSLTPFSSST